MCDAVVAVAHCRSPASTSYPFHQLTIPSTAASFLLPLLPTEAAMSGGMPIRKPGLVINIPGGSAAAEPQLPYSQRPQPNMGFRGPQVRHPLQQHRNNCTFITRPSSCLAAAMWDNIAEGVVEPSHACPDGCL
jgi:hypothetical protein